MLCLKSYLPLSCAIRSAATAAIVQKQDHLHVTSDAPVHDVYLLMLTFANTETGTPATAQCACTPCPHYHWCSKHPAQLQQQGRVLQLEAPVRTAAQEQTKVSLISGVRGLPREQQTHYSTTSG